VAVLALLAPTTTRAATLPESPSVGNIACLSDTQRTELLHREMVEFLAAGKELTRNMGEVRMARSSHEAAAAALKGCEGSVAPSPAPPCVEERERLARAQDELQRIQAHQEKARAEFAAHASARIQAVRSEYPSCDSTR
jgi:hypothetical protein